MKTPRGNILLEFLISLGLLMSLSSAFFLSFAKLYSLATCYVEAFLTARAQIYGQDDQNCRVLNFWPSLPQFTVSKRCVDLGHVECRVSFGITQSELASAEVRLRFLYLLFSCHVCAFCWEYFRTAFLRFPKSLEEFHKPMQKPQTLPKNGPQV